ncbi:hypothetical protein L218DRAFT_428902 [Marasmius fiardii PR-910]|nr:hypothetical protein L218DRAFT_428902 [Marasmius fiardii PR-910]
MKNWNDCLDFIRGLCIIPIENVKEGGRKWWCWIAHDGEKDRKAGQVTLSVSIIPALNDVSLSLFALALYINETMQKT